MLYNSPKIDINKIINNPYKLFIHFEKINTDCSVALTPYDIINSAASLLKRDISIFDNDLRFNILNIYATTLQMDSMGVPKYFDIKLNMALDVLYLYNIVSFDIDWKPSPVMTDEFKRNFELKRHNYLAQQ